MMNRVKHYSVSIVFLSFLLIVSLLLALKPKAEYSENEKRKLADFPQVSIESVAKGTFGKDFETYLSDHFPLRDMFFGIDAYTQLYTGRNGLSGIYACDDGYLIPTPEVLDSAMAARNISFLSEFAQATGLPTAIMAVPNPGYILADKLPKNHLEYMDDEVFSLIEKYAGGMKVIDLRDDLKSSDLQVYYRTDHHLTSEGSYEMYQAYCNAIGVTPKEFSCRQVSEDFYGTGYSKSGLWLKAPDNLEIWKTESPSSYRVTIKDYGTTEAYDSLYFTEHLENMDQYPVFLDGNHELTVIENQNVKNGKRLLLIKDSYAHCFATFAAEDYEMICMVDLRYYRGFTSDLIAQYGLNEILYLYGVENLACSTDIGWLM